MTIYNSTEAMDVQKLIQKFFEDNEDFKAMLKHPQDDLPLLIRELKDFLMDSILDQWLDDNCDLDDKVVSMKHDIEEQETIEEMKLYSKAIYG